MPNGPRWRKWWTVSWSGPGAVEVPAAVTAARTWSALKEGNIGSRGCCRIIWRRMRLDARVLLVFVAVNCLQKALEMSLLEVRIRLLKAMCWLGEWRSFFPERERRRDQKRAESCLRLHPSTLSTQDRLASAFIRSEIWEFRSGISGEPGELTRRESLRLMRTRVSSESPGRKFPR